MLGWMPCTHLGHPGVSQLLPSLITTSLCLDPSSVCLEQSCCLGVEGKAALGSQKASKIGNSVRNRTAFSGSLMGHVGRRAQGRSVIRKCSAGRWCLPVGWRRRRWKGVTAGDSVRTPRTGVAATSSFQTSGKSFKFPSFEKKENTSLSHTSLGKFPWAKPSWSLSCGGTADTRLLQEDAAASFQITPKLLAYTKYLPLYWSEVSLASLACGVMPQALR